MTPIEELTATVAELRSHQAWLESNNRVLVTANDELQGAMLGLLDRLGASWKRAVRS